MLSGFTSFKNSAGSDLGEQMLNKVASQSIRHLFSQSELVDVSVKCFPSSKLLQGSIDSFKMNGRGLLIRKQFWVEEMWFETDAVAIDFSSVLGGKIRLKQPTQAVVQVTLTEVGINEAFQADLVSQKLSRVTEPELMALSGGEPVSFSHVELRLQPHNQICIFAKAHLPNGTVPISLTATLAVERRRRIAFQNPKFEPDGVPEEVRGTSEVLTLAFAKLLDNMVDLDRFDLAGVMMRINRLETDGDRLIFSGYAQIEQFPTVG
jgi:LmeA-like phospholipid-binding